MRERILFFSESSEPGGAETVFLRLVEHFSRDPWEAVVVLMKHGWLHDELLRRGLTPRLLTSGHSLDLGFAFRLARLARHEHVQLIHAHLPDSNAFASLAGAVARMPVIATYHGMLETFGPLSWKDRIKLRIVRTLASQVVAVSDAMRNEFIERAHFPPSRTVTVHNGIDWKCLEETSTRAQVEAKLNLKPGLPVVGMIGTVRPVKGHTFALNALSRIREAVPGAQLLIAGTEEYPYRDTLEREVQALGLSDAVRFLGFRSNVGEILRALDVFIMPSLSEGHPLATIEAMGAGLPVVVSDVGGHPEIVQDGVTGYLVPPGDPGALANRVIRLLTQRGLRETMAARGRESVRHRYSMEQMVNQHATLYMKCLGRQQPVPGPVLSRS